MISLVAVGSIYHDDAIAWQVLDRLNAFLGEAAEKIKPLYCHNPAAELLAELQSSDRVLIVDALLSEHAGGQLIRLQPQDLLQAPAHLSSHQVSVAGVIQLAKNLGRLPEQLWIYGITIDPLRRLDETQQKHLADELCRQLQWILHNERSDSD